MSSFDMSDDEKLMDLLRLIVTKHPGATSAVTEAFKKSPHLANSYLTFTYKENDSSSDFACRCHYDHEYMTYITEDGIDFEAFSHVAKNVVRGYCRHAQFNDSPSPTGILSNWVLRKSEQNLRRHSVDFDLSNNNVIKPQARLTSRRSSSSLRSLELNENNRGLTGLKPRKSSLSLRSLAIEVEEIKGQTQTSLMHAAAAIGDASLLVFLLRKAKTSLEQIGKFQLSPLHLAILKKQMCYMKHIILRPETFLSNRSGMFKYAEFVHDKYGTCSAQLDTSKLSLIGLCIKRDDLETMHDIMNTGFISDYSLERALKEAVDADSVDAVELLLQCGARPCLDIVKVGTSKSISVFESIFRRFRKDFKVYIIQHPDHVTRELLMPAILTRNVGAVRVLIQNGAPVSSKGFYSPLTCSVLENQPEIVQLLLEKHAERNAEMQGYNLLDIATCMGFTECAEILRKFGMKRKNRHIKSTVPCNLLLGIASRLELPLDQMKLHRQLDSKRPSHDEDNVLHAAVKLKLGRRLLREVLKSGSNVNAKNKRLETPLMCAVSKDVCADIDVIRELLYFNPVLEQSDRSGKTTLAMAIARDHEQRVNNLNAKTEQTAEGSETVATLLLDCGYNVKYDDVKKPHHTVYALKAVWRDLAATIGCGRNGLYVQMNPKSLMVRSREVVRRSYPGIRLHKFLEFMKCPQDIKDIVLMVSLLKIDSDE